MFTKEASNTSQTWIPYHQTTVWHLLGLLTWHLLQTALRQSPIFSSKVLGTTCNGSREIFLGPLLWNLTVGTVFPTASLPWQNINVCLRIIWIVPRISIAKFDHLSIQRHQGDFPHVSDCTEYQHPFECTLSLHCRPSLPWLHMNLPYLCFSYLEKSLPLHLILNHFSGLVVLLYFFSSI